jgi:hypothetical protein
MKSKYYRKIFSGVFYIITLVLINSCVTFYQDEEEFIDRWQTNREERYKMVKNINKNNLFIGNSKEEILEKLGEFYFIFNDNHIRYNLGFNADSRNIFYIYKILFKGEDVLDIFFENDIIIRLAIVKSYDYPKRDFNKDDWDKYIDARFTMTEFIIDNGILIGKTREEVVDILGIQEYYVIENNIYYYIGFKPRFINIDPYLLGIIFENDLVINVYEHRT